MLRGHPVEGSSIGDVWLQEYHDCFEEIPLLSLHLLYETVHSQCNAPVLYFYSCADPDSHHHIKKVSSRERERARHSSLGTRQSDNRKMGRKLDALLGKRFNKSYKLTALINLSLSRLAILKNQRQSRYSLARSDVIELLNLGHHERALFRVELVIKEQNMLDALAIIEGCCSLVMERVSLIQQEKECPEELKEAVSSLIYASSRTGEFPELKQMRSVFTTRFGKDFTARSIELRNNCTVNLKMIQKLSTRQPSLDSRLKALKEIASDNKIDLALILDEYYDRPASKVKPAEEKKKNNRPADDQIDHVGPQEIISPNSDIHEDLTENSMASRRKKYTDVAVAAEEAFRSATNAAAAAKAAVELSRSGWPPPHNFDDEQQINLGRRAEDISEANKDNGDDDEKSGGRNFSTILYDENIRVSFDSPTIESLQQSVVDKTELTTKDDAGFNDIRRKRVSVRTKRRV